MNTAGTKGVHVQIEAELVDAWRTKVAEKKDSTTDLIRRWIEKYLGRKPSKSSKKRGRPPKSA